MHSISHQIMLRSLWGNDVLAQLSDPQMSLLEADDKLQVWQLTFHFKIFLELFSCCDRQPNWLNLVMDLTLQLSRLYLLIAIDFLTFHLKINMLERKIGLVYTYLNILLYAERGTSLAGFASNYKKSSLTGESKGFRSIFSFLFNQRKWL